MATENKRMNANKVPIALPKADSSQAANAQLVSQDVSLQMAVGSRARIHTAQPNQNTIEGTIYVADPITNLLVLNTSSQAQASAIDSSSHTAPSGTYRLIPMSQITSFQILSLKQQAANENSKPSTPSPQITLDTVALNARLQRNISNAQQAQARQGPKGTSGVNQAIFDALSRQFQTRWQGTSMVITEQFIIEKPYEAKSVKLLPSATGDLERMKKIFEMEKRKAELKQPIGAPLPSSASNNASKNPPTGNHRKGG